MTEETLAGGVDNVGAVVRVGDTVRRPSGAAAAPVRAFLQHLERVGFAGAPRFHGVDEQGREVLDYVAGDVALPPYPDWVAAEELLLSIAELQRDLHTAAVGFELPDGLAWPPRRLPTGAAGHLVCHADLCVENVVVRNGRAVAFIDFDLATPADRLFDIAVAARHWIPLRDPVDIADARADTDLMARFRAFADVHGLSGDQRRQVIDMLGEFLDQALESTRKRAEDGHPGFARLWADGYEAMNRRSRTWLAHQATGRLSTP
ncbi:MAG TPA: aminoglycoside phosphotransferase family protein [Kutzneria sp.]|nr:aminoglycoside phosphotransferase family protein [Kutzneria sp.]